MKAAASGTRAHVREVRAPEAELPGEGIILKKKERGASNYENATSSCQWIKTYGLQLVACLLASGNYLT